MDSEYFEIEKSLIEEIYLVKKKKVKKIFQLAQPQQGR